MAVVSGGTTLIDNGALDAGVPTGSLTLLSTQTASASATIDFTSGIDSSYDVYCFKFYDIHPQTDIVEFKVNFRDGGASFDATKTTTLFNAYHKENGTGEALTYESSKDLAQSTGSQILSWNNGNDNDQSCVGSLFLYNPSSTTFVKHFISRFSNYTQNDYAHDIYIAGYCNTTNAIDGVQFSFSSGNIDDGIIKMYGVS